ncbi:leishmanolysin [Luteolibacter arcticus]|uniref:Leishmanolysin n=1 Tax=Luteolibacter arcticus TaxID=1581411 RepID=A0ABT3GN14_9BACT|nr:leishmanolysin [Luteolibacter arcticus]MCW1924908.1 leishmanolysin [Luteolibacter arcticus]
MKPFLFALMALAVPARAVTLLNLTYDGAITGAQRQQFDDAAAFWNSTITGYDLIHNSAGQVQPHSLTINVSVPEIDGVGGILGSAGPETATYYDNNPVGAPTLALFYTASGSMEFDAADVDDMIGSNTFFGVVLHEMAHVLGIGTLWTYNTNLAGPGTHNLYTVGSGQYFGANALSAWQTEFGQAGATFVPVELGGGPGTAEGHWNEVNGGGGATGFVSNLTGSDFSNELMTGWAAGEFFLSKVTLGGLDDLGYVVDYSKAGLITYAPVPEPAVAMLAISAAGLGFRRRRGR